jgi:hypothetical protein
MRQESDEITCKQHGRATTTFVCSHLAAEPMQRWHSARASESNRWPDAWCDLCNAAYLQEGEWNSRNSGKVELKILCHHCYEKNLATSIGRLEGLELEAWRSFVEECHEELRLKQDQLQRDFQLSRHKRWDWDQEQARIVFSNDGAPAVAASIEFVGSISTQSETWLWSWANPHVSEPVRSRIPAVYDFGQQRDYPHLVVPKWTAQEVDGWEMAAVAAHVLGAAGVYRTPGNNGFTFLLLKDVRLALT